MRSYGCKSPGAEPKNLREDALAIPLENIAL